MPRPNILYNFGSDEATPGSAGTDGIRRCILTTLCLGIHHPPGLLHA